MKLDKETFVKHGFWFALGGFVLLWLIGMIVLKFSAGTAVAKEREVYTNSLKGITDVKNPKNESFLTAWNKYAAAYEKEKDKVWEQAFLTQNPPKQHPKLRLMTWPSGDLERMHRYPDDPFTIRELNDYKETVYPNQFKDLTQSWEFGKVFGPKGPVVLAGGLETMVPRIEWTKTPTPEEVWLAQEDFWVRRELLRTVKAALAAVGRFERVGKPEKLAGNLLQFHFKNKTWDVNLILEPFDGRMRVSGKSTIKNVHPARRTMALGSAQAGTPGLGLRLTNPTADGQLEPTGFPFSVPGDPVAFGETREFKQPSNRIDSVNFTNLENIGLEQAFDLTTSPIKQVNQIVLAYNSHRTAKWPLKQWELFKPKEEEGQDASGTSDVGANPGGPGPGSADAAGGPGMMAGMNAASNNVTLHGLVRNRYLTVNPYVRCMPVALVMVVDQAQLQDVEAAILNSRLRIQITQESWVRVHNFRPGGDVPGAFAGGVGMPGAGGAVNLGGGMMKFRGQGGGPSLGPAGPSAGGPGAGAPRPPLNTGSDLRGGGRPGGIASDLPGPGRGVVPGMVGPGMVGPPTEGEGVPEDDPNLVELSVYGIASVYERYPANPNKKKDESPK